MKRVAVILSLVSLMVLPAFGSAPADKPVGATQPKPAGATAPAAQADIVQIAVLLDTSKSMDGLINQARAQLWQVINTLAQDQVEGQRQEIQVALYQYGSPSLGKDTGYIRQCVPLTNDLDKVSAALFGLATDGGDEYCGWVIKKAVDELKWSTEKDSYKAIFIAGNEPFTQGPIDFWAACRGAEEKGIFVHTVFCGAEQEGNKTGWKEGATLGKGVYSFIDQGSAYARAAAPQDRQLAELSGKLNNTYVPYGANGRAGAANQAAQDKNAGGLGGTQIAAERAITKSTSAYKNIDWDLVDAIKSGKVALKDLKPEDLPEEMRALNQKGREDYLAAKLKEREGIQAQIKQLSDEREKYLAALPPSSSTGMSGSGAGARGGGMGGMGGGGMGGGGGGSLGGAMGRAMGGGGR
jgi:hypothetical protein